MPPYRLDVALAPVFVAREPARRGVVFLVVDVIRATTTLTLAFEAGCARILVASSIERAREQAERRPGRYILGGELGGVAPAGFDLGNSPAEYARADLSSRELLFVTTNGTNSLRACVGGFAILAAAYRNATSVTQRAVQLAHEARGGRRAGADDGGSDEDEDGVEIVVVCAGRGARPSYDDTLCAGRLIQRLAEALQAEGHGVALGEGARIAADLSAMGTASRIPLRERLAQTDAGRAIAALGLAGDLAWCAAVDQSTVVPRVVGVEDGLLVLANDIPAK